MDNNLLKTLLDRAMPHKMPSQPQYTPHLRKMVQFPHSRTGVHFPGAQTHMNAPDMLNFMNKFPFKGNPHIG